MNHGRAELERKYHESEDMARDENRLVVGLYGSGVFDEAAEYQIESLGDVRGARVLDYGCGSGRSAGKLRARGASVTAFDISQVRLLRAQDRLNSADGLSPFGLLLCDAQRLPFPEATFDAVLGKQILHHLDLGLAIPEIARVLRPGGRAVFLEPLIHNPLLQGYRRLTPHLRSPEERALSMDDLSRIGASFGRWTHKEFCLLAVVPALAQALVGRRRFLTAIRRWLQRVDRRLIDAWPFVGRYCWETVIILER